MSDAEIVAQVLAGNTSRFEALLRKYAAMVRGLCASHVYDADILDDLVQESFVAGYVSLHTLRDRKKFGPWIAQITRNKCQSWVREHIREKRGHDHLHSEPQPSATSDPMGELARRELCEWVRNQIGSLPDKTREAMLLCYVEGLTIREAAEFLDASESSVKKRLQYGRDQLGERIWTELGELKRPVGDEQPLYRKVMVAVSVASAPWKTGGAVPSTGDAKTIFAGKLGAIGAAVAALGIVLGVVAWNNHADWSVRSDRPSAMAVESQGVSMGEPPEPKPESQPAFSRGSLNAHAADIPGRDARSTQESPLTQSALITESDAGVPPDSGEAADSVILNEILETLDEVFAASVLLKSQLAAQESRSVAPDGAGGSEVGGIDPFQKFGNHNVSNRQISQLTQIVTESDEIIFDVYADQEHALAASHVIGIEGQPSSGPSVGYLIFELNKDESGRWSMQDIDFGDYEDSASDVDRFLGKRPNAKLLTE